MNATILVLISTLLNGQIIAIPSETGNEFRCEMMKKSVFDLIEDHGDFLSKAINYNSKMYNQDTKVINVYCMNKTELDSYKSDPNITIENMRDLTK